MPNTFKDMAVHYRVHNSPPTVPILNQINLVHAIQISLLKALFNIIIPSTPRSSKWSRSLGFPHQNSIRTSRLTLYVSHAPPILLFLMA